MSNKNIKQQIFSAISLCSYPPNVTDSLIELITEIMNYQYVKSIPQYKIKTINQEKIIAVRCPMEVPFNKRNYEVPIVVFFSKFIPLEPPKVFLEVSKGSAINPKTRDVDLNTRKIMTPSLRKWNQASNITNILNEIRSAFNKVFPIYKIKRNQNNDNIDLRPSLNTINFTKRNDNFPNSNTININNNAVFNFVNNNINNDKTNNNISPNNINDPFANIASIFTENFINNQNNANFNITYSNSTNNNSNNFMNKNINNINVINFNDNNAKNILIEAVYDKISTKLISEYKKLNQQNKNLNNYKNQFKIENEKMEKYIEKKQEITNKCTKDLYNLNNEIRKCNEYIKKKKDDKITDKNCLEFIKIDNPKELRAIASRISYEELLIMIKKGFEKNKIDFKEAVSSTRNAARDLFISIVIKEKRFKNI